MKHDTEKLQDLYVENYLQHSQKPSAAPTVVKESVEKDEDEDGDKPKAKGKSKKKPMSNKEKGAICYDSVNFNSHFDRLLREFDEQGGGGESFDSIGDTGDSEYNFDEEDSDEQVSVSKSVLKSIIDQLKELVGEGSDEDMYEDEGSMSGEEGGDDFLDDEVPLESYGFEGNGKEHGAKGNYDGRAKVQPKSNLVKDNGDANFGKQDTKYAPEDTEGSEGAHHGDQGNYDGKAKTQPKSSHVKDNGDANFGKAKTGYGKPNQKNYF